MRDSSRKHAVLVWGDSHARHLQSGLAATLPPDWQLLMVASPGCRARLESGPSATDYCRHSNWFAWHTAKTAKAEVVVVAHRDRHQPAEMRRIAAALLEAGVHRVVFPGPIPEWSPELAPLVVFRMWDRTPQRTWLGVKRKRLEEDLRLRTALTAVEGVTYVSLTDQLCNGDGCLVFLGTDRAQGITTHDYGHFTAGTSRLVAERALIPAITQGVGDPAKLPPP